MGGSSTKTITNVQIIGIMDTIGDLRKSLFLNDAKNIGSGMGSVIASRKATISQLKGLYNDGYLTALGYNPSEGILVDKISEENVLTYTQDNLDTNATIIRTIETRSLTALDQSLIHLQELPNFDAATREFTYLDDTYAYLSSVQNGSYIDIVVYLNRDSTVVPYLEDKYPEGYTILTQASSTATVNGVIVWAVEVEYTYEIIEDIEGVPTPVIHTDTIVENIPIIVEYIQIQDIENDEMVDIATQHTGSFSVQTCIPVYRDRGDSSYDTTECLQVSGNTTVTYLGSGTYNISVIANNPYHLRDWRYTAVESTKTSQRESTRTSVETAITNRVRKVIWKYSNGNSSNTKIAYRILSESDDFVVQSNASSFPIIPLKRGYNLVNSTKQDIMLKQIGFEGKDFHNSLRAQEIRDGYLSFGVPVNATNPAAVMYIFELFATLSDIREAYGKFNQTRVVRKVSVSYDGLSINQSYGVDVEIVPSTAKPIGTYWYSTVTRSRKVTETDSEGHTRTRTESYSNPTYYKQEGEDYYIKIERTSLDASYSVAGIVKEFTADNATSEVRIPLVRDITLRMPMNEYTDLIEQSMCLIINSIQTYTVKWYQKGFFKFIMIIVIAVVSYFTAGAASAAYGALYGAAAGAAAAGVVYAAGLASVLSLMGMNTGAVGQILQAAAALVTLGTSLLQSGITFGQQVLYTASTLTNLASIASQINLEGTMKSIENSRKAKQAELEASEELLEEVYENTQQGLWMGVQDRDPELMYLLSSTAMMCNYDLLYDYDGMYDGKISSVGI